MSQYTVDHKEGANQLLSIPLPDIDRLYKVLRQTVKNWK